MKPIPGHPHYFATQDGSIVSVRSGSPRRLATRWHKGYLHCNIKVAGRCVKTPVHQLVLAAFSGPRPAGCLGRHLNGLPVDNQPDNLA